MQCIFITFFSMNNMQCMFFFKYINFKELILLAIFTLEFSLRVWGSGATGTYGASGGLKKYLRKPHMIIGKSIYIKNFFAKKKFTLLPLLFIKVCFVIQI